MDSTFPFSWLTIFLLFHVSDSFDTITSTQFLSDAKNETLLSSNNDFRLGFFSTVNTSSERYLGIWFNKIPERHIVWVANRNDPIVTKDAVFKINTDGNIVIFSDKSATKLLWSSNISDNVSTMNPTAKLLDSGNLELTVAEGSHGRKRMWQSFDYPTDTILPGMKLGLDRKTGLNRVMTSWKSKDNPAEGEFIMTLETEGLPQFFLRQKNSDTPIWRAGPWNGVILSGVARLSGNLKTPVVDFSQFASLFNYTYIDTKDEVYMTLTSPKTGRFRKYVMNFKGLAQQSFYHATDDKSEYTIYTNKWVPFWSAPNPSDGCDKYMTCGKNSICNSSNSSTTNCTCLPGYERESDLVHCKKKRKDLNVCRKGNGGGFVKLTGIKLPDSRHARYIADFSLKECEVECLKSCKCNSYASANVQIGGKGCYLWEGELNDIKAYQDGQEFYLRVDSIELAGSKKSTKRIPAVVIFLIVIFGVILLLSCLYVCRKYTVRKGQRQNQRYRDMMLAVSDAETTNDFTTADNLTDNSNIDLTFFDLDTIIRATDNFSPAKKLGQGSFGPVFKAELSNGHEIAVKRLSRTSGQGISEFKNEALLIAKLQHRNLVRLLGCCIDEEEKMLIYEYMPNKSLDYFIFDESKKSMLNWRKRHEIIVGIARGILYLHQDSRLKIIHRDLKASNILLDIELNPKISDFGTARIFGGNQVEANTCRVVGTFGYMSPEYALDGYFSVKSDVYSFGVLLLEIISGKKNNRYFEDIPNSSLIKHVWESWSNDRALEIADTSIPEDFLPAHEVLRCIQVGLLCVQDNPADRPTMSTIVFMLSNEATLPSPKQPMVAVCRSADNTDTTSAGTRSSSINGVTMTNLSAR